MKITCALSQSQIEKLYANVYGHMLASLKGEKFDANAYMQDLFDKLADKKDVETAAKFLQQVPTFIGKISYSPGFEDIDVDDRELKQLVKQFKNPDTGLDTVLKHFRPTLNPLAQKELIQVSEGAAFDVEEDDVEEKPVTDVRLKPYSALTTTFQEFVSIDPTTKKILFSEELDDKRKMIYTALRKINDSLTGSETVMDDITYQGRKIKLKPVKAIDILDKLDESTARSIQRGRFLEFKGSQDVNVTPAAERILMVISDQNGNLLYFDQEGNLTTEDKGVLAYQFLRDVRKDVDGYTVTNMYGYDNTVKSPKELAELLNIPVEEAKEMQQQEFKQLYDYREAALKGKAEPVSIIGISPGVPEIVLDRVITLNNLRKFPFGTDHAFKTIKTIKEPRDGFASGVSIIVLNGKEFQIDRPNAPEEILTKVAAALTNPKLNNKEKYIYVSQFFSDKASESTRKHSLVYLPATDELIFKYYPKTYAEGYGGDMILVDLSSPSAQEKVYNALKFASGKDGNYFSAKMQYNSELLSRNGYQDYNTSTGELSEEYVPYIPFLESLKFTYIKIVQNAGPGFFNPYIHFALPNKFNTQVNKAKDSAEPVAQKILTAEEFNKLSIPQKFNIILDELKSGAYLVGKVTNDFPATEKEHTYQVTLNDGRQVKIPFSEWFNKDLDLTKVMANEVALQRDEFEGEDAIGVFSEIDPGIRFTYVNKNPLAPSIKLKSTPEVVVEETKAAVAPENVAQPTDGKGTSRRFFLREGKLPADVTEEQVKNAQTWWENSPLKAYLDFDTAVNIVNSDAYARFTAYANILNGKLGKIDVTDKGSFVDVYHEAWHGFSQLFLTKEKKIELYKELRKTLGRPDMSFFEAEEYLAEDFRTYAKDQNIKKGSPVRNTIFRRIWNFIQNLFKKRTTRDELFQNLYLASSNPKFLNNYSPSIDNVMFDILNRGAEAVNDANTQVLSRQDSNLVKESMDSIISQIVDMENLEQAKAGLPKSATLKLLLDSRNRKPLYEMVNEILTDRLNYFKDKLDSTEVTDDNEFEIEELKDKVRILQTAIDNYGDANSGMVKYHIENSTFSLIRQKYIEGELDEEGNLIDPSNAEESERYGDKQIGDKSLVELAGRETIYVLKSLNKLSPNGKKVKNKLGFTELVDFRNIWNNTVRTIGGIQDPQEMYNKLVAESENVKEFKQLLSKLANPKDSLNFYEFKTTTSFWQDFSKPRVPYIQLTIFDNNIAQVTEASIEIPNILKKFEDKYKSDTTNPYIKRTENTNTPYVDIDKVVNDFADKNGNFDVSRSYEFTRAIGLYLDDLSVIKKALKLDQDAIEQYGLQYIYKAFKAVNDISKDANSTNQQKNLVRDFKKNPIQVLTKGIEEGLIGPKKVRLKNKIDELATLQGRYGFDSSNFGVLNAERNLVFEHVDNSTLSRITYALNNAESMADFWAGDKFKYMSYLDPRINSFTKVSRLLKGIFDYNDNYTKKANKSLDLFMNSGTQIENSDEGLNTTSMDSYGKLLQEMHTMLKGGVQEFMRHASKKSSYGVRISGGIDGAAGKNNSDPRLWIDLDMFADNTAYNYAFRAHFLPYIASEVERINRFKENKSEFIKYAGYNRKVGGTDKNPIYAGEVFTAFDDVLTKDTKAEILEKVNNSVTDLVDYLKNDTVLRDKIKGEVQEYFNKQVSENTKTLNDVKYISQDLKDKLKMYNFTDEKIEDTLVSAYTYNSWIHNFETAGLFYGDVTQYNHAKEELHKRNTGLTSGGRIFRTDSAAQNFINGWVASTSYAAKQGYTPIAYDGTFNTAVVQDVIRRSVYYNEIEKGLTEDYTKRFSKFITEPGKLKKAVDERVAKEVKKYKDMEEGDGQGWITFDAYRSLKMLENNWSDAQEALFQKIIAGEKIGANQITEFFPVYKVQNFGHLANTKLPVNAMHKFALAPLIPSVIAGSDLDSLHKQMMEAGIEYVTFQTGSKVGSVMSQQDADGNYVADKIYDNEEQASLKNDIAFTPNTIYLEYLKNVTAVPTEYKAKTVFATQLRKLILGNLYEKGTLVNSKNKDVVEKYESLVKEYSDLLKYELLEEIGYKEVDGKYIGNVKDFMEVVQRELGRRGMSEHQIDFVGVTPDNAIKNDLSLHLRADDIEKILVALVEKRLVRQKVKGEALVQVASSMSNKLWDSKLRLQAATEEDIMKYLGTNNLPFYTKGANGKTKAMKVAIALQGDFNNLLMLNHLDGNRITTRERLNEMIKSDEWLNIDNNRKAITMSAVRIPVQGLNSMEFMEVYEFLDPAAGNIIIPPSEIVAKSGGDFDVDKLTTFMPSIAGNGQFVDSQVSFEGLKNLVEQSKKAGDSERIKRLIKQQKSAIENKLITSISDILSLPDNYAALVRPNDTYLLKEIADDLQDKVIDYDRYENTHDKNYKVINDKIAISPTRVFEVGYNLHKHDVNMTGKTVLGIVAVENSLNPILNSLGAAMPKTYKNSYWDPNSNRYVDGEVDYKMRLLLPHNKMGDGRISLSDINTVDGQDNIADLLSQMMNGLVDVEKDAWVFFIQANIEIIPTLLYLMKAGVPKEQAILFASQPLVREYAKQQRLLKSAYANYTGNFVEQQTLVKYQAAQNALKPKNIEILNSRLFADDKPRYDQVAVTELVKENGKVKFPTTFYTPQQLMDKVSSGVIDISSVIDISEAKNSRKVKTIFKPIGISNKNYYPETIKYSENADLDEDGNFKLSKMKSFLESKDTMSDDAVAMFLHFLEIEKQIKGIQTLKRQMNPDTRTSKTLQETTRRNLALEDAKEMSKIDAGLVERAVKESILGSFFDNKIIQDLIQPLFTIRNADQVTDFIIDATQQRPAEITKTFGAGADGVRKFISEYKNAVTNYLFQNYMANNLVQDGNIVDVPNEYLQYFSSDVFAKDMETSFADEVMQTINRYPDLKVKYNILNQLSKPSMRKGNEKILTLNDNKLLNEPQLAELYYENLKDLANPNVKKVSNAEENLRISNMFRTFPLISIFQTGTGYHKFGFNQVLPYEDFLTVMRRVTDGIDLNNKLLVTVFESLTNPANKYFKNYLSTAPSTSPVYVDMTRENFIPESEVADVIVTREKPSTEELPTSEDLAAGKSVAKLTFGQPTTTSVANIPQNKVSGVESFGSLVTANAAAIKALGPNPHSIDMIEAGFRTRTTRSESEMAKYAIKVGDTIKHFGKSADDTTKTILAKVTAIHPKGSAGWKGTWNKEGWRAEDINVIDRFKDGAAAIEFEVIKPTQAPVSTKIEINPDRFSRESVIEDANTMYLFTDNAQRTSAPNATTENVDKNTWYYKKYKSQTDKPIHFGSLSNPTSAIIRGLNNAYPISTMSAYGTNWTDANFDLFKQTIDDEINQIKQDLSKFSKLKIGNYRIGQGGLKAKLPEQHQNYLDTKLKEIGIDNTESTPKLITPTQPTTAPVTTDSKKIVEDLFTNAGGKKVSKGMLQVDGQHWYIDNTYWKIVYKEGRDELFFYPDDDTEIYIGDRPAGTKNFTIDEDIDTRSFTELEATTQPTGEVKPGVSELFESKPELVAIGTPQQYSEWINYLTTQGKLAGTKATDILYHGTYADFEEFSKEKRGANTGLGTITDTKTNETFNIDSANAFFFSDNLNNAYSYSFLGRHNYLQAIMTALESIVTRFGRQPAQEAVDFLKSIPYFDKLISNAKSEGKSKEEITDILKGELQKLNKKFSFTDMQGFTNALNNLKSHKEYYTRYLTQVDRFKANDPTIKNRFGDFSTYNDSSENFNIYFDDDKGYLFVWRTGKDYTRAYANELSTAQIKNFFELALKDTDELFKKYEKEMKSKGYEKKYVSVLLDIKNPLSHDYEESAFPDRYKESKFSTQYVAARQVAKALKEGNDAVIYENIVDPLSSTSYGVFEPEQVYILGGKEDLAGFKNFIEKGPTTISEVSSNPDTFADDMNEFNNLVSMTNGVKPTTFDVQARHWVLNNQGYYDLVDKTTGEIYLKDIDMQTGLQVYKPNMTPVDEARRANAIKYLNDNYKLLDTVFAEKGYDIKDIISKLESLSTQEELNDIITNILKKLC